MRSGWTLAGAGLACAWLLACGAEPEAPAPQAEPVTFSASTTKSAPRVELIDAGGGSPRVLRLRPTLGDRQTFSMRATSSFSSRIGDAPGPAVEMPSTRQRVELVVEDVGEDGDIRCRMERFGLALGADPAEEGSPLEKANEATALLLERAQGELVLDPRAFVQAASLELALDADTAGRIPSEQGERFVHQLQDSFVAALEGALPALPDEPIGPGARWVVVQERTREGKRRTEEYRYEVVSLDETGLELAFRFVSSAPRQSLTLPDGGRGELVALRGEGRGELSFDLERPLPRAGALHSTATWEIDGLQDGEVTRMTTSETLDLEFAAP